MVGRNNCQTWEFFLVAEQACFVTNSDELYLETRGKPTLCPCQKFKLLWFYFLFLEDFLSDSCRAVSH